jgi:segregation and condensation protein B
MTSDPTEPPESFEPYQPYDSVGPAEPADPSRPVDPVDPVRPVDEAPPGAEPVPLFDDPATGSAGSAVPDPGVEPAGETTSALRAAAKRAVEGLVLVTEQPLSVHLLGQLLELSPVIVDDLCRELAAEYEEQGRGFQLVEVAGGWRYQSHPDLAPYVERFVLEGQTAKLSAAALETLAIVAYKQPISRAQVASIRGVSVDGVMRTLEQRGYIAEVGRDPGPGQAVLFGTTPTFMEKLGLNTLDDLPPLGDFVPGADVVEQLERGLRPDREPLRPEDAMAPGLDQHGPGELGPSGVPGEFDEPGEPGEPGLAGDLAEHGEPGGLGGPGGVAYPGVPGDPGEAGDGEG